MRGSRSLLAPGLVLAQITSLQIGSGVAKDLFAAVGPAAAAAMRIGLAALLLGALVRPRVRSLTRGQCGAVLGLGVVLAAMNLAYFQAIAVLPLGVAATLELLGPLGLAILLTRRVADLVWVLLAGAGVLLFCAPSGRPPLIGIALGLLAAGCRAGYVLLNRRVGGLFTDWSGLALALAVGAGLLAPIGLVSGGDRLLDPGVLGAGLLVAVLSSVLPYSLDLLVLRRVSPRVFGILLSLGPAVGALVGYLMLGEVLTGPQLLAVLLVGVACVGAMCEHPAIARTSGG